MRPRSAASSRQAHSFSTTIEGERYDRLVHADLKPGHIFVRDSGEVIVLDFGIAKALDKSKPLTTNNWGTSAYMSPERLLDGRVDEHVDFWSLGVMLYEMLAGHRPYRALQAPSLKSQLERAIRGNAPREPLPATVPRAAGGHRQQAARLSAGSTVPERGGSARRSGRVPRRRAASRARRVRHAGDHAGRRAARRGRRRVACVRRRWPTAP